MKTKKRLSLLLITTLTMTTALTDCGGTQQTTSSVAPALASSAPTESNTAGFTADAAVGVTLPWLGIQNWKEADEIFRAQLETAGFKATVQHANNKVPQQQ